MMLHESRLRAEHLTVGYQQIPLLRDVCLSVQPGEILALIGPNGAGKTTLLKTLLRQLAAQAGTVYLNGRDMAQYSRADMAKTLSAVQTVRTKTELLTVWDVVAAGRYPYTGVFGRLSEADREKVRAAMAQVQVQPLADRDFDKISDGQRQRVLLARALCQEPRLLVLDEPTSFLDIRYKLEFLSLLQELARTQRLAVILSLHELELAQRVADRLVCIGADGTVCFGAPDDVFAPGQIEALFDIRTGGYDALNGTAELKKPDGKPRVFVIGGAGYGIPVYRKLQRAGVAFTTGILWQSDVDFPVAAALSAKTVSVPAFASISEQTIQEATNMIAAADWVVQALPRERMTGMAASFSRLTEAANGKLATAETILERLSGR